MIASISLAVVFVNAASGSVAYARMKRIDYRAGLLFAAAAVPGAVLGSLSTHFIPRAAFDVICGGFMVAAAAYLFVDPTKSGEHPRGGSEPPADGQARRPYNPYLGAGISAVVGYVSSVLGIGGGFIHVPALVRLLSFPVHMATATSHFILAIMALTGTLAHILFGSFHHEGFRRTALLAVGVVPGAQVGAWLSNRVSGSWIVRGLAVVLLLVGIGVLRQGLR